jgi:hypothetical protein
MTNDTTAWFGRIMDIAVDDRDRVYVADWLRFLIVRVDVETGQTTVMGREGEGPAEFRAPRFIVPLDAGDVGVYDYLLRRFTVFDQQGDLRSSFNLSLMVPYATAVEADGKGHVFVSGAAFDSLADDYVVHRFLLDGTYDGSFGEAELSFATLRDRGRFDGGSMVWDDSREILWISRNGPRFRLQGFRADGTKIHDYLYDEPAHWEPMTRTEERGDGQVLVTGRPRLGTLQLLHVAPDEFVNTRRLTSNGRIEFARISIPDGRVLQRWFEDEDVEGVVLPTAAAPDGTIFDTTARNDTPDVVRYRVRWMR